MHDKIEKLHAMIWSRFFEPRTGLMLTFINPRTKQPVWPTVDEVLRCIPNTAGWQTPMEDNCLCAGSYLDSMLMRHAANPTPENERRVREVFRGLKNVSTCGRRRGFIARGLLPDLKTYYPDTSVDQYTYYLYGMWRYFHSPLATADDRAFIQKKISDICLQFEEDEFFIQTDAGAMATFGDINAMLYTRVERVLQPFAIGWKITGNKHFFDVYEKLKAEQNRKRMEILEKDGPSKKGTISFYALLQTQIALRCLYEIEPESRDRDIYDSAMTRIAHAAGNWIGQYKDFPKVQLSDDWEYDWRKHWNARKTDNIWIFHRQLWASGQVDKAIHAGDTIREPSEGILCQLLANDPELHKQASATWKDFLATVEFDHVWDTDTVIYIEMVAHLFEQR